MWSLEAYPKCCDDCEGKFINLRGEIDCKARLALPNANDNKMCRYWYPKEINGQRPEWYKIYILKNVVM